jgi:hypothetical protein
MRELFIYYRVRPSEIAAVRLAVRRLQDQLCRQFPPLRARLLQSPEPSDDWQTWMEVYSTDPTREPAGISAQLQSEIEMQAGVALPMLDGMRHCEVFIACAS